MQWKLLCISVLLLAVGAHAGAQEGALPPCDPSDPTQCCLEACTPPTSLPTLAQCLLDACDCARQLDCYLEESDVESWPLFPQSEPQHLNTGSTHGRFLTTRVNPIALTSIERALKNPDDPAVIESGGLIVKANFLVDPENPGRPLLGDGSPFPTVMYKLDGYCPEGNRQANGECSGGEWFWYLKRFDRLPFSGKPLFCLDCHGAARNGDWAWELELFRRFPNNVGPSGEAKGGDR